MKFTSELALFLKARYPIIYINTIEEDRVEYIIRKNIKTNLNRSIYSWDFVDGYTNNPNNEGFAKKNPLQALELVERINSETPALFLLKDFNRFLTDLSISRKLRNISRILKLQPKTIIIIGSDLTIPKELQDLITVMQFYLPLEDEINQELNKFQLLVYNTDYIEILQEQINTIDLEMNMEVEGQFIYIEKPWVLMKHIYQKL